MIPFICYLQIFPVVYISLTLVITLLPVLSNPVETGIGFVMILSAVPVYVVFIAWEDKPGKVRHSTKFTGKYA